jgi:hypothetical protein
VTESAVALLAISVLLPSTLWCSLRVAAVVDLDVLPTHSQRRIHWLRSHAGYAYLVSAALAVLAIAPQIVS